MLKRASGTWWRARFFQPPSGGCVLKPRSSRTRRQGRQPAAFRRLCVETTLPCKSACGCLAQPPSGGCVLKRKRVPEFCIFTNQPPSGGCVLKLGLSMMCLITYFQPPSGGCVLKPAARTRSWPCCPQPPSGGCVLKQNAAALGQQLQMPAAFRRLCVETVTSSPAVALAWPAAFRRLCVETARVSNRPNGHQPSRLQAAVC